MPSLDYFTRSLTIPFVPSLPSSPVATSLSHYRTLHHRSTEAFILQTIFIIQNLKKLVKLLHQSIPLDDTSVSIPRFCIGILIPDIAPETGEFLTSTLLRVWRQEGIVNDEEVHLIKRPLDRDAVVATAETNLFHGAKVVWGWDDSNVTVLSIQNSIITMLIKQVM